MRGKDWLSRLQPHDPEPVQRALDAVHGAPPGQKLDADVVREGLAACEVVAAAGGQPAESLPPEARGVAERWAHVLRPLREKARAVLERLGGRPQPDVDLRDLYDEPDAATEDADANARAFRTEVDLLMNRLSD
jgi:hypothetical protein